MNHSKPTAALAAGKPKRLSHSDFFAKYQADSRTHLPRFTIDLKMDPYPPEGVKPSQPEYAKSFLDNILTNLQPQPDGAEEMLFMTDKSNGWAVILDFWAGGCRVKCRKSGMELHGVSQYVKDHCSFPEYLRVSGDGCVNSFACEAVVKVHQAPREQHYNENPLIEVGHGGVSSADKLYLTWRNQKDKLKNGDKRCPISLELHCFQLLTFRRVGWNKDRVLRGSDILYYGDQLAMIYDIFKECGPTIKPVAFNIFCIEKHGNIREEGGPRKYDDADGIKTPLAKFQSLLDDQDKITQETQKEGKVVYTNSTLMVAPPKKRFLKPYSTGAYRNTAALKAKPYFVTKCLVQPTGQMKDLGVQALIDGSLRYVGHIAWVPKWLNEHAGQSLIIHIRSTWVSENWKLIGVKTPRREDVIKSLSDLQCIEEEVGSTRDTAESVSHHAAVRLEKHRLDSVIADIESTLRHGRSQFINSLPALPELQEARDAKPDAALTRRAPDVAADPWAIIKGHTLNALDEGRLTTLEWWDTGRNQSIDTPAMHQKRQLEEERRCRAEALKAWVAQEHGRRAERERQRELEEVQRQKKKANVTVVENRKETRARSAKQIVEDFITAYKGEGVSESELERLLEIQPAQVDRVAEMHALLNDLCENDCTVWWDKPEKRLYPI